MTKRLKMWKLKTFDNENVEQNIQNIYS